MSDYSFETDDVFDRKRYAQFLISVIQNSASLQRTDGNRSYTICLDSGYGTGKSIFLSKLRNWIEENFEEKSIGVVSYNAWQNDYYDNAFVPFLYALLNDQWLKDAQKVDSAKGLAIKARRGLINTGKVIAKSYIKQKLGEEVAELAISALDGAMVKVNGPMDDVLKEYKNMKKNIDDFNTYLELCLEAWQFNKLVIIIDELDRCKPDFAIRTLEITKHLMNVKNVVFLFALDKSQLSKAVEKVYGYGMDSEGYLCKFFDYITVMPPPDVTSYIVNKYRDVVKDVPMDEGFEYFIAIDARDFQLTIRDIDIIMSNYKLMLITFLSKYDYLEPYHLYFVCLVLKYKYPQVYHDLLLMHERGNTYQFSAGIPLNVQKRMLSNKYIKRLIEYASFRVGSINTKCALFNNVGATIAELSGISSIRKRFVIYSQSGQKHLDDDVYSINGMIFEDEWDSWENINCTFGMHLHKKLEMINFVYQGDAIV